MLAKLTASGKGLHADAKKVRVEHFAFIANAPSTRPERRTVYPADGQPIGTVPIYAVSHVAFRDANGNSVPDPGEITPTSTGSS